MKKQEQAYSYEELLLASASFGVKTEVVAGAIKLANKTTMTRAETEEAIKDFLERQV